MRSTAATQDAHDWRVHCAGWVISGCSTASQRPALAMIVRIVARTRGVSVEVSCQRSTQLAQTASVPSMPGAWL
jgi:hypothetical protein